MDSELISQDTEAAGFAIPRPLFDEEEEFKVAEEIVEAPSTALFR